MEDCVAAQKCRQLSTYVLREYTYYLIYHVAAGPAPASMSGFPVSALFLNLYS